MPTRLARLICWFVGHSLGWQAKRVQGHMVGWCDRCGDFAAIPLYPRSM